MRRLFQHAVYYLVCLPLFVAVSAFSLLLLFAMSLARRTHVVVGASEFAVNTKDETKLD